MFEVTKSSKVKKHIVEKRTKFLSTTPSRFFKSNFITRIIQRLNLFDILIVVIITIAIGFMLYSRIQRKPEIINVRLSVENADWWYKGSPPESWYAKDLKVGDTIKDSFGNKSAEVVSIENYDNGGPYRNIYIYLKLKVSYDAKRNLYLYDYKPLTVGSYATLNFSSQQIQGLIIDINEKNIEYNYKTILVQKKSYISSSSPNNPTTPEFADNISVGDKSYDNNNDLIAEILNIQKDISSYYQYSDIRGQNIKTYNPAYRDLTLTVKIKTYNRMGISYYINKAAVKIGSKIWLQFPEYSLEDYQIIDILN